MTNEGFKCQECGRVFQKKSHLVQHAVVHLPPQFACEQCGRRFKEKRALQLHMKTHDPERKKDLKCDVCGMEFFDAKSLERHMKTHDPERKKEFKCDTCGMEFFEARTLERHKKTHEEGKYACDECGERFRGARFLIAHKKRQHNQDKTSFFACSECPKVFDDEKKFQRHLDTHTPYEERKFVCDQCGKRFLTKQFLDIHKRTHEDRDRSFICKECGKGFLDAMSLNNHQKSHMKYEDWPALCEVCGQRFQDNTQLKSHIWYKHTEKETFDCERCGNSFLTEEQLTRHLNRKTPCKERKIPCPYCEKMFPNRYELKVHKQGVHKDIVEFECPKCEETFRSLEEMEAHRQTHEEGLTCNICEKVLYSVEGFNQHMQRHEQSRKESSPKKKRGKRPGSSLPPQYVCQDCKRRFASMINLNQHSVKCPKKMGSNDLPAPVKITASTAKTDEKSNPDKKVACPLCGKNLSSKSSLVNHLRKACPHLEKYFTCRMCNSGKMDLLLALIHVAECKVNCDKTIQCNYCLKEIPASNYPLHIQNEIIKYKLKNPFHLKCKYCSLSLPNKTVLLLHQGMCKPPLVKKARPGALDKFICGDCNWTSSSDLDMVNHVKESHSIIVTTKAQDKSIMPISSAFSGNKEKSYRFKPIWKCFVCSARFYCQVAGKFHVRSCQKRYGTIAEPVNEDANSCEAEEVEMQQDEDVEASTGVPRLVLVTF